MDKKKIVILAIIIIIALAGYFMFNNHSYSIENATLNINIYDDGLVHINEEYDYSFNGEFNGVYRKIPVNTGEGIENIHVSAIGAYPVVEESHDDKYENLKVYLYADPEHTQKIKDCDVKVFISYDFLGITTLFNDIGGFQYKLWGSEWDVGVKNLNAVIHLPGDHDNTFFVNPEEFTKNSSLSGDTITISASNIRQDEIYELLVLMPLDDFSNDTPYAHHNSVESKADIINELNKSLDNLNFWSIFLICFQILACLIPLSLIITYLKYGREPKVDYDGVYERELPSDEPPEVINTIFGMSVIHKPDMKGFEASILNLIDRKIIEISSEKDAETGADNLLLKFNNDKKGELSTPEQILFESLSEFATDDILNLSTFNKKLSNVSNAKWFMGKYKTWQKTVADENKEVINEYFDDKGVNISYLISIISIILGIILFFFAGFMPTPAMRIRSMHLALITCAMGVVVIFLPNDYIGRWTPNGRVLHLKWQNFKKFLEDNSLIEEHPPESIAIWKKYLIYGAALGVADNVYKSMKLHEPNINEYDDNMFRYHSMGGYAMMHSAIQTGETSANPSSSSSGGSGGFGGGSGGGGGGAF